MRFLLQHSVDFPLHAPTAARADADRWLTRSATTVQSQSTGGVYPNFPDPQLADPARAYWGSNLRRLRRVVATYDPHGALRSPLRSATATSEA